MRNPLKAFLGLAILVNIALFCYVNTKPILWQQHEITYHNFLWSMSMDEEKPFTLQTGFHLNDFKKLFFIKEVEIQWRYRQFGNWVEMSLFKIWQLLGLVTIRSWTLILFHIINTVLLWFLVRRLTGSVLTSWICCLIFLNSGAAFATLLFPFRVLKELLIFLFLSAWLIGKSAPGEKNYGREILFLIIMLAMILTDEMAFLFIPFLYLFLFLEKGNGFVNKRTLLGLIPVMAIYIPLTIFFKKIMIAIGQEGANFTPEQIQRFVGYLTSFNFIPETFRGFLFYFLRRHFGSWDQTILGMLSLVGFLALIFLCARQAGKNIRTWFLFSLLIGFILAKDMLFFHAYGIHKHIMPVDAKFPSILYFSYYYPYIDSLLLVLALGLLLGALKWENKLVVGILLAAVTVMNFSNASHTDEGVRDTVKLHWYDREDVIVGNSLAVQKVRAVATKTEPAYLSFPSGSKPMFIRRQRSAFEPWVIDPLAEKEKLSPDFPHYVSFILVQYLKAFEDGKFIVDLQNIPASKRIPEAKYFYDVVSQEQVDLTALNKFSGNIESPTWEGHPVATAVSLKNVTEQELIIFVKGASTIVIKNDQHSVTLQQTYGHSYQMFRVPVQPFLSGNSLKATLAIVPATPISKCSVWGPFAR